MSTQNPFFTYCKTYPGGDLLEPGDTTSSTGVELGGSGPADAPFVITDSGSEVASGVSNSSGAFHQRLVGLTRGLHRFELRKNASSPATHVWNLTVGESKARILEVRANAQIPNGRIIHSGDSVSISQEFGVRFYLADVPTDHTHYNVFRDGIETGSGGLDNPPFAAAWMSTPSTQSFRVTTSSIRQPPSLPDDPDFVIHWVK